MVGRSVRRVAVVLVLVAGAAGVSGVVAPGAGAGAPPTVVEVTTAADVTDGADGLMSLREAFATAQSNGLTTEIRLAADTVYELTDCAAPFDGGLSESSPEALILTGRGATVRQTCPGTNVISIYDGDIGIRDLTITGGDQDGSCCSGGLQVDGGSGVVLLERLQIVGNTSANSSGGSGLYADGADIVLRDSVIRGNEGIGAGGGARLTGPSTIERTAIIGNRAVGASGGGLVLDAGGTVTSSTIARNEGANIGAVLAFGPVTLLHSTLADNLPATGQVVMGSLTLGGTVIAGPPGEQCSVSSTTSLGQNYSTSDCGLGVDDVKDAPDPDLRPLFDNGGGTLTMYPRATSPLLDAVASGDAELPANDQRRLARPGGTAGDVGAVEVQPCGARFIDLAAGQAFCWEIGWLADAGVTTGNVDGSFGVTAPVTRQSMAAFLYRLAGSPAFEAPAVATFSDVAVGSTFFVPVEWLASTGITSGVGDGSFGALNPVTRQSMSAFLYALAGHPLFVAPETASFPDVPVGSLFFEKVEWLATTGITGGFGDGSFGPVLPVTRQSMAAFLYRFVDGQILDV